MIRSILLFVLLAMCVMYVVSYGLERGLPFVLLVAFSFITGKLFGKPTVQVFTQTRRRT